MGDMTLAAGLLLPWLLGIAVLVAGPRSRSPLAAPGEIAWIAGAGYFVGALLLTLWMRTLSMAGVRFGLASIALPLLALIAVLAHRTWRRDSDESLRAIRGALRALIVPPQLHGAARAVWQLLLGWIAFRFVLLGLEVAWQPLYPWEAWTQWATKSRVWYELGRIVPFAGSDAWFAADGAAYFDAQPDEPPTLPLLQAWACIALGRWDDALMNWPWWQTGAALACAVYGAMRSLGVAALGALVTTYLVASLPLANVHVALAGYADLPLAAYYACAALALLRWAAKRDSRDAALAALLGLACIEIKRPGLGWALTLVPGAIVALFPRVGPMVAAAGFAVAMFLLAVVAQTSTTFFGHLAHLDFAPAWSALGESYFLFGSWNLLWYGVPVAALVAWRQLLSPALAPLTFIAAAGAILLFAVFAFPDAGARIADHATQNRVTLQFAPLAVVFAALSFHAFAVRRAGRAAVLQSA
jgi:hypothetical protein